MRTSVVCAFAILLATTRRARSEESVKWQQGAQTILSECPIAEWNNTARENFLESFRDCVQRRALEAFDSLLLDDVIPVVEGVSLIRFDPEALNATSPEFGEEIDRRNVTWNGTLEGQSWTGIILRRLTGVLRTHVLKVDVDRLASEFRANGPIANTEERVQARRRRHRRRHHMMPLMMMGLLLMGSILIPMGFQFLAVLGGKALILAKMALILSSIQGLKKIATNGVNYGLYHAPVAESWHERSGPESSPTHFDVPYPPYPPYPGHP